MKVTVCFDDIKIIVPCTSGTLLANSAAVTNENNQQLNSLIKVSDIIDNAISRYKKATAKVST